MPDPQEDYIDFPVSDTFRGYFYERGLTPHPPSDMGHYAIQQLRQEIKALRADLIGFTAEALETPVRATQSHYDQPTAWVPPPGAAPATAPVQRPIWDGTQ